MRLPMLSCDADERCHKQILWTITNAKRISAAMTAASGVPNSANEYDIQEFESTHGALGRLHTSVGCAVFVSPLVICLAD